jgi:hypothetical protein
MQIIHFIQAHWQMLLFILVVVALAVAAYVDWQFVVLERRGPRDTVGNGITIGLAKAFDNRSLSLRIERLSNSLAQMKVLDQKATDNIGKMQGQTSSVSVQTFTLDAKAGALPAATASTEKPATTAAGADAKGSPAASSDASKTETKSEVAVAAGDILNEQLNLASQILNLQTLYERSLTDRLIGRNVRLQTVLGFQVSITPPAGFENCVAIVEVAVRMRPDPNLIEKVIIPGDAHGVSLVAMIPQEKTYNAQSISANSQSIGGSAVASVMTLGLTSKGETRQLFVHRDSDTLAFERSPNNEPALFGEGDAIVFGWEFRPVLGRKAVSAGMRQMFAVIALPVPDESEYNGVIAVQIKTRSYWRRYNSRNQTTAPKWHWFPRTIDGSRSIDSKIQELAIPNTAKIQANLEPKVTKISWVNSGFDRATVLVKGENFFPGTKVLAGGKVHKEDDNTLTLKSDQAVEFETTLAAIVSGDSVLSGRFGPSQQLKVHRESLPARYLYITKAVIKQSRRGKDLRISIDVKGLDDYGGDKDLEVEDLVDNLPDAILFIGNEAIPMPYDYWPLEPNKPSEKQVLVVPPRDSGTGSATDPNAQLPQLAQPAEATQPVTETDSDSGGSSKGGEFSFAKPSTKRSIRVEAWIPSRISVTRNSSVMFRVPFCGLDFQASWPLQFFEPTVTRMGGDDKETVFRISHSLWQSKTMTVELGDKIYDKEPELKKVTTDDSDYRFTIPNAVLSQYRNLVLRIEGAEPYLVPIPEDKPKPKPALDLNAKPPEIQKGAIGPVEWTGTELGLITAATLITPPAAPASPGSPASPLRTAASFAVYDGGKKIAVYFPESATNVIGKFEVEFQIGSAATDTLRAPLFIGPVPALLTT